MRPSLTRPAALLALLAICLQVVVCALGGRICLQASPLIPGDGCEAHCCDESPPPPAAPPMAAAALDWLPPGPGEPVCCIYESTVPATDQTDQRVAAGLVAVAPVERPVRPDLSASDATSPAAAGRAAHPPPMLEVVRATVLLI